ncbi:MAG: S-methyl-5'-thioadenosine phosphorylase [Alphaproteobacteria bacterium MarineAlpha9_Bin1]|nr:MAG: S-methyl-5'-thioadenosine phosphorylase [Alphaproteobacteria bacterium MarineAlpha9_Bin1]
MEQKKPFLGIIGGSGLYDIEGLKNPKWNKIASAFGSPSNNILTGKINNIDIAFLPRHGKNHTLMPTNINYRANIDCLKKIGVTDIISFSAVGSLKENIKPGQFLLVDQFIDRTFSRNKTFFDEEIVAHVSMAKPVSTQLVNIIISSNINGLQIHKKGTYLAMEGPHFSTLAESELYRSWNCDVIGMTNMPEAKLAREAEIAYATVAMVTDYDCWHPDHEDVTVKQIINVLSKNSNNAKFLIKNIFKKIENKTWDWTDPAYSALENSIITPPEARNASTVKKLQAIAGRVL